MRLRSLLTLFLCVLLSSCSALVGPRDVELPLAKLQAGLDQRFPLRPAMLELFKVELSRPQLAMLPEQDRVALTVDAMVAPPFLRKAWQGSLVLSGRLFIDGSRNAVLLAEPRIERIDIAGADAALANLLLDRVLLNLPVYQFQTEDLHRAGVQFMPTRLRTTASGLVVSVEPVK